MSKSVFKTGEVYETKGGYYDAKVMGGSANSDLLMIRYNVKPQYSLRVGVPEFVSWVDYDGNPSNNYDLSSQGYTKNDDEYALVRPVETKVGYLNVYNDYVNGIHVGKSLWDSKAELARMPQHGGVEVNSTLKLTFVKPKGVNEAWTLQSVTIEDHKAE